MLRKLSCSALLLLTGAATAAGQHSVIGDIPVRPFEYDFATENARAAAIDLDAPDPEQLRDIFARRRQRVLQAIPSGAMLIFSVERAQERRLEFQVPHSDNHDFIFLTGLEGIDSLDSALLLIPAAPDAAGRRPREHRYVDLGPGPGLRLACQARQHRRRRDAAHVQLRCGHDRGGCRS